MDIQLGCEPEGKWLWLEIKNREKDDPDTFEEKISKRREQIFKDKNTTQINKMSKIYENFEKERNKKEDEEEEEIEVIHKSVLSTRKQKK